MEDLAVQHQQNGSKGRFYYESDGNLMAELTYSVAGDDKIIIDHTEVSNSFRGKGLGKALVFFATEYARKQHISVLPLCPYARSVYRRYAELRDVL